MRGFGFVLLAFFGTSLSNGQVAPSRPAVPLEPISAILDAFKTHQIVALGEGIHGNEQGHAFRLSLIRDPGLLQPSTTSLWNLATRFTKM